jgi:CMP-N,N'-diacetyllegionaminic acid synthase
MRVVGLVLARGGSKGIARKNIRLLGGQPLLAYTAQAALAARRLARVIVSTDDPAIAAIARQWGLEVPFMRPEELARDDTPTLPVVQHALEWLESNGEQFEAVCQLQPTSPFRAPGEIDACIELLERRNADSVMTVVPVPDEYNPHWVYWRDSNGWMRLSTGEISPIPRRQALPQAWSRDGSVYVTRRDVVMQRNSLYGSAVLGMPVSAFQRVNIDSLDDFDRAAKILRDRAMLPASSREDEHSAPNLTI